jgi:mediator of RNA polymerase II transcription subunit 18
MLNGGLYYMQVVGGVREADFGSNPVSRPDMDMKESDFMEGTQDSTRVPSAMGNGYDSANQAWRLEFKDIPEAGARSAVTSRLVASAKIPYGDVLPVMHAWGYKWVVCC